MEKQINPITKFYQDVEEQLKLINLTEEDNDRLIQELKTSNNKEDIINKLFLLNCKLVYSFVKPYLNKGSDNEDIFMSGCRGLVEGIKRFNPDLGYKLSTCCASWIMKYVFKYMYKDNAVYIPEYLITEYIKLMKLKGELEKKSIVVDNKVLMEASGLTEEKIKQLLELKPSILSLDMSVENNDGTDELFLKDVIPDEKSNIIDEVMYQEGLTNRINSVLEDLPEKERLVIEYRFGLNGKPVTSLEGVGKILGGLSSERIRQIEKVGIRKLRNEHRKNVLKEYLR